MYAGYYTVSETRAKLILIDADKTVLDVRHKKRGDEQTERFLRSRRTKIENFASKYKIPRFMNNTPQDGERLFNAVCKIAEEWIKY